VTITGNRQFQLARIRQCGLAAIAIAVIDGCLLCRSAPMMVPLGVVHPLGQALLQRVHQPAGLEPRRRDLSKLLQHRIRDSFFLVRRHTFILSSQASWYGSQTRSFRHSPQFHYHSVIQRS